MQREIASFNPSFKAERSSKTATARFVIDAGGKSYITFSRGTAHLLGLLWRGVESQSKKFYSLEDLAVAMGDDPNSTTPEINANGVCKRIIGICKKLEEEGFSKTYSDENFEQWTISNDEEELIFQRDLGKGQVRFLHRLIGQRSRSIIEDNSSKERLKGDETSTLLTPRLIKPNQLILGSMNINTYAPHFDKYLMIKNPALLQLLNDIRKTVDEELRRIPSDDFSGNTALHARELARMLATMFPTLLESHLSAHELFLLGAAAITHDWGMVPRPGYYSDVLYRDHPDIGADYIKSIDMLPVVLPEKSREEMATLCEVHNQTLEQARTCFQNIDTDSDLTLLYVMLRLVDVVEIRMQAPSLSGASPSTVIKVIGTFTIDSPSRSIQITQNLGLLDERQFRRAVDAVSRVAAECNQVLCRFDADHQLNEKRFEK